MLDSLFAWAIVSLILATALALVGGTGGLVASDLVLTTECLYGPLLIFPFNFIQATGMKVVVTLEKVMIREDCPAFLLLLSGRRGPPRASASDSRICVMTSCRVDM